MYPKNSRLVAFPWRLIKRRVPSIAAGDMCDMYLYNIDPSSGFPTKMLKKKALNLMGDDSFKEIQPLDAIMEQTTEPDQSMFSPCIQAVMTECRTTNVPLENSPIIQEMELGTNFALPSNEITCKQNPTNLVINDPLAGLKDSVSSRLNMSEGAYQSAIPKNSLNESFSGHTAAETLPSNEESTATNDKGDVCIPQSAHASTNERPPCNNVDPKSISPDKPPMGLEHRDHVSLGNGAEAPGEATVQDNETVLRPCSVKPNANDSRLLHNADDIHDIRTGFWELYTATNMQISAEVEAQPQSHVIPPPENQCSKATSHIDPVVNGPTKDPTKRSTPDNPEPKNPDHSQESFLREIDEIHQKVLTSTPRLTATQRAEKGTSTVCEMATQTMPNEIYDPPVKKSELTSQMSYIDRALTNHERRMRANEVWCEREEEKVNKIDSELFTLYSELRSAHEALHDDHIELKKIVSDLLMISPNFEQLIAKGLVVVKPQPESNADPIPNLPMPTEPIHIVESPVRTVGTSAIRTINDSLGPLNLVKTVLRKGCSAYPPNRIETPNESAPIVQPAKQVNINPEPPSAPKPQRASVRPEQNANRSTPSGVLTNTQIPRKVANAQTGTSASNISSNKPVLPKHPEPKQHPFPAVKRTAEKKRNESPIESFLKEAKRVIPTSSAKRTQVGNERGATSASPDRHTSTPIVTRPQTQPLALNNMYAVLDQDAAPNPASTPTGPQFGTCGSPVDIASPDDFPPLPTGGRAKTNPLRPMNPLDMATGDDHGQDKTWADIDDEENETIDAFLASVEGTNIDGCGADNNPQMAQANAPMPPINVAAPLDIKVPENVSPMSMLLNALPGALSRNNAKQDGAKAAPPPKTHPFKLPQRAQVSSGVNPTPTGARPKTGPMYGTNRPDVPRAQGPNTQTRSGATGGARTPGESRVNSSILADPPRQHKDRVVTKNGWFTAGVPQKRKRTRSSPNTQSIISGGQTKPYRDVFVRNLKTENYNGPEDMADAVQDYCEERGVGVYFIKVMSSLFEGFANIKLTVATCDYATVVDNDFWPPNVSPREWYVKDKKNANNGADF